MRTARWALTLGLGALLAAVAPASAHGQEPRPDTLARAAGRPLADVIAALPGEPIRLEDVVAIAMERNLDLDAARMRRRSADADLQIERGLFDPTLSLRASLDRDALDPLRSRRFSAGVSQILPWGTLLGVELLGERAPRSLGGSASYDTDALLTLRQPLLDGLGTADVGARAARALRDAAAQELVRAGELVAAEVEVAYWTLAEAEATEAVLQRSVEIAEALVFRNQQLAERQIVPELDVVIASGALALRRTSLISARQARENAAERLVFLAWGADAEARLAAEGAPLKTVGGEDLVFPAAPDPLAPLLARALSSRADVAAARELVRAAEEVRRGARRGLLPTVDLTAGMSAAAADSTFGGSFGSLEDRRSWSLGIVGSYPLFNRRDRGLGLRADMDERIGRIELTLTENLVRMEVRAARRALAAGAERRTAAEEASSLARAQLVAEQQRLDLGLGDSFRLLQTEEIAAQAEMAAVRARFDSARAAAEWRLAIGSEASR